MLRLVVSTCYKFITPCTPPRAISVQSAEDAVLQEIDDGKRTHTTKTREQTTANLLNIINNTGKPPKEETGEAFSRLKHRKVTAMNKIPIKI